MVELTPIDAEAAALAYLQWLFDKLGYEAFSMATGDKESQRLEAALDRLPVVAQVLGKKDMREMIEKFRGNEKSMRERYEKEHDETGPNPGSLTQMQECLDGTERICGID